MKERFRAILLIVFAIAAGAGFFGMLSVPMSSTYWYIYLLSNLFIMIVGVIGFYTVIYPYRTASIFVALYVCLMAMIHRTRVGHTKVTHKCYLLKRKYRTYFNLFKHCVKCWIVSNEGGALHAV